MSSNDGGASYWSAVDEEDTQTTFNSVPSPFVVTISKHNYIPKVIQSSEAITFSGSSVICSSAQYSIGNVPAGATIYWTQSANLTRVSAQGANPCTFSVNGAGEGWIRPQIITTGNDTIDLPVKTVWLGAPVINSILGNSTVTVNEPGSYTVTYDSDSNPSGFWWGAYPYYEGLTINPQSGYNWTSITFPEPDDYTIVAQIQNTCGWSSFAYKNIEAIESKSAKIQLNASGLANGNGETGLSVSPNPAACLVLRYGYRLNIILSYIFKHAIWCFVP